MQKVLEFYNGMKLERRETTNRPVTDDFIEYVMASAYESGCEDIWAIYKDNDNFIHYEFVYGEGLYKVKSMLNTAWAAWKGKNSRKIQLKAELQRLRNLPKPGDRERIVEIMHELEEISV